MVPSLEQAIAKARELSEDEQAFIAHTIMELIEDEAWRNGLVYEAELDDPDDEDTQEILAGIREAWIEMRRGGGMTVEEYRKALESDD